MSMLIGKPDEEELHQTDQLEHSLLQDKDDTVDVKSTKKSLQHMLSEGPSRCASS